MELLIVLIVIVIIYPAIRILIDKNNEKIKRKFYPKEYNADYDSPYKKSFRDKRIGMRSGQDIVINSIKRIKKRGVK